MNLSKLNAVDETRELSIYLQGVAVGMRISGQEADKIERAAHWMEELSQDICGQGYIGCVGGRECTSDHK